MPERVFSCTAANFSCRKFWFLLFLCAAISRLRVIADGWRVRSSLPNYCSAQSGIQRRSIIWCSAFGDLAPISCVGNVSLRHLVYRRYPLNRPEDLYLVARSVCYVHALRDCAALFPFWLSAPPDVCQLQKVDLYSTTV